MAQRIGDETIREFGPHAGRDPLIGATVDSYRIESIVGSGAMGIVYRARHTVIGKVVAIKVLKPDFADDPEMVQRLVREARTVNAIRHPSIVDAFGFGTLPRTGQPYIVMDLLDGEPLDAFVVREAPVSVKVASGILDELLSALAAAHQVGVIHRDLKPGNCFLETQPDGGRRLKLLDFGLARQADRAGGSIRPTNPGSLIGTPAFMAPEQVMGQKVTPATDLYAVGGMAYQMLTGHLPHEGPSAIEVLTQKMKFDPVRPKQWNPAIDDELDAWIVALLEREPEHRERDADIVRRQLRRISERRTVTVQPVTDPVAPAAPDKPKAGVVPKRQWGEARTILVEGSQHEPPPSSTESHISPWATAEDSEPGFDPTLISSSRAPALASAPLPTSARATALGAGPVPASSGRGHALGATPLPPSGRAAALGAGPVPASSARAPALGVAAVPPSRANLQPIILATPLTSADVSTVPPGRSEGVPTVVGGVSAVLLPEPEMTPPSPTLPGTPQRAAPLTLPPPDEDEPIELPPSQRGLVAALVVMIVVLIVGVLWLVKLLAS